ncbi:MAG: hypothetical protein J6U17_00985 [Kiritimatiellae bacterium]|nr:hypothetical protein [Kiritimatiellia bacterium]
MRARCGQVALYLVAIIVAVCILALMNVDTFTATRAKWKVQDGGDAAALAAARRQGSVLNEIGRLNIAHILAVIRNDRKECEEIVEQQKRLALLGPVQGLSDASAAAEANGIGKNPDFSKLLMEHANVVRTVYTGRSDVEPFPEPFEGAWDEYATAIELAASAGLATGADNMRFYCSPPGGHMLLDMRFYNAINGRDWCWFHFVCESLLNNYTDWTDWGPIPEERENYIGDCEIFPLFLQPREDSLLHIFSSTQEIASVVRRFGGGNVTAEEFEQCKMLNSSQTWYFLGGAWGDWFDGYRLAGEETEFPIVGTAKPEYNVRGCAAVCRCLKAAASLSTDSESTYAWSAAAKPFGKIGGDDGGSSPATAYKSFLVPCFDSVRLVPLDSVEGASLHTADVEWVAHIRDHIPKYLAGGPGRIGSSCKYCSALKLWEKPSFRRSGVNWLKHNAGQCVRPAPGGTLSGGGTSHGH